MTLHKDTHQEPAPQSIPSARAAGTPSTGSKLAGADQFMVAPAVLSLDDLHPLRRVALFCETSSGYEL